MVTYTDNTINDIEIVGRHAFGNMESVELLCKYMSEADDYIEIGTLYGASAILAGLHCAGDVYCIDPLDGYYGTGRMDRPTNMLPSVEIVRNNWERFNLDPDRLHIYAQCNPPFPADLVDKRWDVGYIDGDHTYSGAMHDWIALKDKVNKYILFDNVEKPDVRRVFDKACEEWTLETLLPEGIGERGYRTGVVKRMGQWR